MNSINILYIGRFQPFHKGHADALLQIFKKYDTRIKKIYIGIGSAEDNFSMSNPLTCSERFEILEQALLSLKIPTEKWAIVPIRNIDHYDLWPFHVQQYLPPIHVLASGSSIVKSLWNKAFPDTEVYVIEKRESICATEIRKKLLEKSPIDTMVLETTNKQLTEWNIADRLHDIAQQ